MSLIGSGFNRQGLQGKKFYVKKYVDRPQLFLMVSSPLLRSGCSTILLAIKNA